MKRAAIYARVSRAYKEDDERVTIENQLQDCEEYCQKKGYVVVEQFVDKDKYRSRGKQVNPSGERKDRPGFVRMLKAAKRGEFDVIIAWKEDRLYRGMYAALPISELLDEYRNNVSIELVTENFDEKMLGIKAAMGKIELDNIRERMVRGKKTRLERGEVPGGPARYGYYKNDENRLEVNEDEATIVQQVFEWYNQGFNNMEIRRRLNAMEIPPRINKVWSKATIQKILTFEGYAMGEYITTLDDEPFTIQCPVIISVDTWQKSLETRTHNTKHRSRNVKEDYLCRGLVVCLCGWKWGARMSHSNEAKGYTSKCGYYACMRKGAQPEEVHADCPGTIGSQKLDRYVWDFVVNICRNPEIVRDAIDAKIEILQNDQRELVEEAEAFQRELDNIQSERQWVITQARKGRINADDMDMQLAALHFQYLDLNKKYNELQAALAVKSQAEALKEWAEGYLKDIERGLETLETDPAEWSEAEQESLYDGLEAGRFIDRFSGDRLAALRWAIFEEKRLLVRTLIKQVLVVKGKHKEKIIIPELVLEIPADFAGLVYDTQALEYRPAGLEEHLQFKLDVKSH